MWRGATTNYHGGEANVGALAHHVFVVLPRGAPRVPRFGKSGQTGRQPAASRRAPDEASESQSRGTSANRVSYSRARIGPASRSAVSSPTTIAQPPHPAPVSRAPWTPGNVIARSTTQSSSGREHSYRSRSDS